MEPLKIEKVAPPTAKAAGRAKTGSKYEAQHILDAADQLVELDADSFFVAKMPDATIARMKSSIPWYLNRRAATQVTEEQPTAKRFYAKAVTENEIEGVRIWRKA